MVRRLRIQRKCALPVIIQLCGNGCRCLLLVAAHVRCLHQPLLCLLSLLCLHDGARTEIQSGRCLVRNQRRSKRVQRRRRMGRHHDLQERRRVAWYSSIDSGHLLVLLMLLLLPAMPEDPCKEEQERKKQACQEQVAAPSNSCSWHASDAARHDGRSYSDAVGSVPSGVRDGRCAADATDAINAADVADATSASADAV